MRSVNQIRVHLSWAKSETERKMINLFSPDTVEMMKQYAEDVENLLNRLDNPRPLAPHERISRLKKQARLKRRAPRPAARLTAHGSTAHGSRLRQGERVSADGLRGAEVVAAKSFEEAERLKAQGYIVQHDYDPPTLFGSS